MVDGAEVTRPLSHPRHTANRALITPFGTMRAEPWVARGPHWPIAPAGACRFIENCAATCTSTLLRGVLQRGITNRAVSKSSQVVLAGGCLVARCFTQHGISMPQLLLRENCAATEPLPSLCGVCRYQTGGSHSVARGMAAIPLPHPVAARAVRRGRYALPSPLASTL